MRVTRALGVTEAWVQDMVTALSLRHYEGNLQLDNYRQLNPRSALITLRVRDSRGPGARRVGRKRRRSIHATWQAHFDFLEEFFAEFPRATVTSAAAIYRGRDHFHQTAHASYHKPDHNSGYPLGSL